MKDISSQVKKLYKILPKFPDGRIDYTNANVAAILICFLKYQEKILLLKRSDMVWTYKGFWSPVAGYLDELKPLKEKVKEELKEELDILEKDITEIKLGKIFEFTDKKINKTWIVHPTVITFKKEPIIKLDWEHTEYAWVNQNKIANYQLTPTVIPSLERL